MAHRAVATKPAEYFLETHRNLFEAHNEKFGAGISENEIYRSEDILAFHNLVTHDKSGQKQAPGGLLGEPEQGSVRAKKLNLLILASH